MGGGGGGGEKKKKKKKKKTVSNSNTVKIPDTDWLLLWCFRNPPNFDTDYMFFNVRMWPFLHAENKVYSRGNFFV